MRFKRRRRRRIVLKNNDKIIFYSYLYSYPYQPKKFWGGNEVLPEFCDVCPNHDFRVHLGYDKKIV